MSRVVVRRPSGAAVAPLLLRLTSQGVSICTRNRAITGVAFLFRVTLRRPEIADQIQYVAEPQKLPLVLSPEEVRRFEHVHHVFEVDVGAHRVSVQNFAMAMINGRLVLLND